MSKVKSVDEIIEAANKKDVSKDVVTRIAYDEGINKCIHELNEWIALLELTHKTISDDKGYKDQEGANREHGNSVRLLKCIKSKLMKACVQS